MKPNEIGSMLALELRLDLRQRHAFGGLLLYVIGAVYVCYLSVQKIADVPIWNALFWVIQLFAAFNALSRSFQREEGGRQLYLYTLVDPRSVILARTAYNALVMVLLTFLSLGFYALFLGVEALAKAELGQFLLVTLLGGVGFAAVLTLISALAARAGNGLGLMAILGFPVVLPMLLTLMRASRNAIDGLPWQVNDKYVLWLLAIDALTVALAWLLYPYLWRD